MNLETFDPGTLTLAELCDFEEAAGVAAMVAFKEGLSAKAITALVWVLKRRDDPQFTLDDARATTLADLGFAAEGGGEDGD